LKHHAAVSVSALLFLSGLTEGALQQPEPAAKPAEPAIPAQAAPAVEAPKPKEAPKPTLKVGDPAPALSVEAWVKGEPVAAFQPGKVYVVEFFATWCMPCVASIPQMTEMQRKHEDLTVICIAGSERAKPGETDDRLANLQKFVSGQGAQMGYRVGYDSKKAMSTNWLNAAGQRGIPCGFVVDGQGKIAQMGHPLDKEFQRVLVESLAKAKTMAAAHGLPAASEALTAGSGPAAAPQPAVNPSSAPGT